MSSLRWIRAGLPGVVALLVATAGCDSRNDPASPLAESTEAAAGVAAEAPGKGAKPSKDQPKKIRDVRAGSHADRESRRIIGAEGGAIDFRGHRLTVPAGAVDEPTLFRIAPVHGGYIELELQALHRTRGTDVGALGFKKPLTLALSYSGADDVADVSRLAIAWVLDDGTIVLLPSVVDREAGVVRAELNHFSKYAMVAN